MTTLLDRVSTAGRRAETRSEFRLPAVARGRRPLVAVASTALVLASVAIFASLYSSADHQVPVLVVTTTIHQGQRIIGSDLGTVDVAASGGLSVVPVADATELSGTWAASTIPAGSLINRSDVTTSRPLAVGTGVVGLALKDGQLPAGGVEPGDRVMIVVTPATGSVPVEGTTDGSDSHTSPGSSSSDGALVSEATVYQATVPASSSASGAVELVSVVVPSNVAADVASASASSQVSLVLLPSEAPASSTNSDPGATGAAKGSS